MDSDEKFTLGGSEFQTFTTRSVKKETTSITPRTQFVQFVLVATSISNSTRCEKVIKINIDEIEIICGSTKLSRREDVSVRDLVILDAPIGGHRCTVLSWV